VEEFTCFVYPPSGRQTVGGPSPRHSSCEEKKERTYLIGLLGFVLCPTSICSIRFSPTLVASSNRPNISSAPQRAQTTDAIHGLKKRAYFSGAKTYLAVRSALSFDHIAVFSENHMPDSPHGNAEMVAGVAAFSFANQSALLD
jgi:hypothetical protein